MQCSGAVHRLMEIDGEWDDGYFVVTDVKPGIDGGAGADVFPHRAKQPRESSALQSRLVACNGRPACPDGLA